MKQWKHGNMVINVTPHIFLTPPIEDFYPATNVGKNFATKKLCQFFKLSHPIVMGGGAEAVFNQITFIFSKEWHGNILSMHLNKFRKSEKWKNKEFKFVNQNYISIFPSDCFSKLICILYIYSLIMQTTKT